MKEFKFTYIECSIVGRIARELTVKAKTEKSAWKKLFEIQGNRSFDNIVLVA